MDGSYYFFMGAEDAAMGKTGITCDISYFQSLYFDGKYTYASCFNESKDSVTLYAVDTESTGAIFEIGTFADSVWPVAALTELSDSSVSSSNAAKFKAATVSCKEASAKVSHKSFSKTAKAGR